MDPYLEDPQVWSDVHASFIVYLREYLRPLLQPRYIIAIESRVFVEGPTVQSFLMPGYDRPRRRHPKELLLYWRPTRRSKSRCCP